MNKILLKDTARSIRKRMKIFLSIMIMAFLGVGFYSGLKITAPNMALTQKKYFDKTNMYDLQVYTKEGIFNNEDIEKIKQLDAFKEYQEDFSVDSEIKLNDKNKIVKIITSNDKLNKVIASKGSKTVKKGTVLLDRMLAKTEKAKIGDKLYLNHQLFQKNEYEIIGFVDSPLYISLERGTTTIGTGKLDGFIYLSKEDLTNEMVSSIYIYFEKDASVFAKSYKKQIAEFKKEVKAINKNYIVMTRSDNYGASIFDDDVKRISNIATLFPAIFFLVAALISLTSTTRMVEEERVQIGMLKALGYKNSNILAKYVTFAMLASLIGGTLGALVGVRALPIMVYSMYRTMYNMKNIALSNNMIYPLLGTLFLTASVVGATIYSCMKELRIKPAQLMRPKAPKHGKRVLIERYKPLWKRLSFTSKVTLRNLFRYKKRFVMTVAGVAGCMSLIIAGFGLRQSVSSVIIRQYEDIFAYNLMLISKNKIDTSQMQWINEYPVSTYETASKSLILIKDKKKVNDVMLFTINPEYDEYIKLRHKKKELKLKDDEVALSKKAASLLSVKAGDTIKIKSGNEERYVKIDLIVDNYILHYIYMSSDKYESIFSKKLGNNALLIKYNKSLDENKLSKKILEGDNIATLQSMAENKKSLDDVMKNLNYVAIILIVAAAALALAVLYTLSNVNISERIREVATIKVLGFKDNEVYNYIAKENTILVAIGILFGIISGYFVNAMILKTAEIDMILLPTDIPWYYYLLSVLITIVFSYIVSVMNYFALKKVNMIESLKSVE